MQNADPITDCALQYRKIYELVEEKKHLFSQSLSVEYEGFCSNPESELDQLLTRISSRSASFDSAGIACRNTAHDPDFTKKVLDVLSKSSSRILFDVTKNLERHRDT